MTTVVQAVTLSGRIIEQGRWEIGDHSISEGHTFQINIPTDDPDLLKFLVKQGKPECSVERDGKDKKSFHGSVTLSFSVKQVRHLLETTTRVTDTLVIVTPANRVVEQVSLYILDRGQCDDRWAKSITNSS